MPGAKSVVAERLAKALRRFNPFKPSVLVPTEPPFDPRKQSWAAGALAATEVFVGALFALPLALAVAFGIGWLFMRPYQRQIHHLHNVTVWTLWQMTACTLLAAALLWAGLALLFGWRSRYRAHGALALVLLTVVTVGSTLVALGPWPVLSAP
jgi:hypothetical protein